MLIDGKAKRETLHEEGKRNHLYWLLVPTLRGSPIEIISTPYGHRLSTLPFPVARPSEEE